MQDLEAIIEDAFEKRAQGFSEDDSVRSAVEQSIALLDSGDARVAEKRGDVWQVNQLLKKLSRTHFSAPGGSGGSISSGFKLLSTLMLIWLLIGFGGYTSSI